MNPENPTFEQFPTPPQEKPLHKFRTSLFIILSEFFIIYFFLVFSLILEMWLGIIVPNKVEFDIRYLFVAFSHSASALLPVFIIYTSARRGLLVLVEKAIKSRQLLGNSMADILLDVYIIIAGIIMSAPIKAVLQDTRVINTFTITEVFVKYDFIPTIIIVAFFATFPIIAFLKKENSVEKYIKISIAILVVLLVGIANSTSNYQARIFEARAAWKSKQPAVIIEKADLALKSAKTNQERAMAYYWLGVGYNLIEDPEKAVLYQTRAVSEDQNFGQAYSSLAYAYLRLKKPEDAKSAAEKCIQTTPEYAWCYTAMGEYFFYINDFKNGYIMFLKARKIDPQSPEIEDGLNNVTKYMRENNISIE